MSRTLVFILLIVLLPATAAAQATVELTDTQRSYNDKGVSAIRDGKFPLAISSFESSLTLGEANVTYLNLGRAYQRAGECLKAREAYGKVAAAPAVAAPSRAEILAVLDRYSGELPAACPATVTVLCDDPKAMVSLDGGTSQSCSPSADLEVGPGPHNIVATLGDQSVEREVSPAEGEELKVAIVFPDAEVTPEPEPGSTTTPGPGLVAEAPPTKRSPLKTIGLVSAAVGVATLSAAFINDYTWVRNRVEPCESGAVDPRCDFDAAQSARTVNGVLFAIGGGLTVGGAILYLVGGAAESGLVLQFNGGPGIAWTARFR